MFQRPGLSVFFFVFLFSFGTQAAPVCAQLFEKIEAVVDTPKIETQQQVLEFVGSHLSENKTDRVIQKFTDVFEKSVLSDDNRVMSEAQFFNLYTQLKSLATEYNIRIESKLDTMGVFPEGLDLIKIAGFSEPTKTNSAKNVGFARRHELAHLFHVIALRAIIAEHAPEFSGLSRRQLEDFVNSMESGRNYLEFEKIVTDISGVLHVLSPLKSGNERYGEKLRVLLEGLKPALLSGKVKFSNGWGIIELYAKFVSKAPLVLGKSFGELAVRLPFIYFATHYLMDSSFRQWAHNFLFL